MGAGQEDQFDRTQELVPERRRVWAVAADDAEQDSGAGPSEASSKRTRTGTTIRAALAVVGVVIGLIWTARIAIDGSVSSGVLLHLLPPVALIYLSIRYFRSVTGTPSEDR